MRRWIGLCGFRFDRVKRAERLHFADIESPFRFHGFGEGIIGLCRGFARFPVCIVKRYSGTPGISAINEKISRQA